MEAEQTPEASTPDPFDAALDGLIAESKGTTQQDVAPSAVVKPLEPPARKESSPMAVTKADESDDDLRASVLDEKPSDHQEETIQEINEYPPTVVSKKARENWDTLKSEKLQERKRADAAEKRVKELESTSGIKSPEVSVLTKERDEWKSKFEAADKELALDHIEKTNEFQDKVMKPGREAEGFITKMIETYSLNPHDITKALEEENEIKRNESLSEIADGINGRLNQEKFYRMAEQLLNARATEDELRANSHGTRELAETKRKEEEAAQAIRTKEEYEQSFSRVVEKVGPKLADLQDSWQKIIDDAKADDFDKMPPTNKAFAVLASHSLPALLKKYNAAMKEIAQIKEVQKSRAAASPAAGPGAAANPPTGEEGDFMNNLTGFMNTNGYRV